MKLINIFFIVILSVTSAFLTAHYAVGPMGAVPAKEGTYDRVMRTRVLRCGYAAWPPLLIKDPNSGKLSGVFYDYVEGLGKALNLKIDWAEETAWGEFPAALESGRIDAFCAGAWPNASRASRIDFTTPISFQPIYAYVRAQDKRFDGDLGLVNNPSVTTVSIDGEMSALISTSDFPKAKTEQMPQMSSSSDLFLNIVMGKGDVTFTDPLTAKIYEANNPGKIRRVASIAPLRVFGNPLAIARGQGEFRRMIDTSTEEMLYNGEIEKILRKYEQLPGALLRVLPRYQISADRN